MARQGQEGSRWINYRPTGEEVADWFGKNVKLHDGMEHDEFVQGVTLIGGSQKENEITGYNDGGRPVVSEVTNQVYTPYVKVETRIAYFHKLMEKKSEWIGLIEPVRGPVSAEAAGSVANDPGFYYYKVRDPKDKEVWFLVCVQRVRIFEREGFEWDHENERVKAGKPVLIAPPGSKAVPLNTKYDADPNAVMKAQTGAIGRALGFAGMLVVPGTGVATAEDMQEAIGQGGAGGVVGGEDAALESRSPEQQEQDFRTQATAIIRELQTDYPGAWEEFTEWARGRSFGHLSEITMPALKGIVRKLEKARDEAREKAGNVTPSDADLSGGGPAEEEATPEPTT